MRIMSLPLTCLISFSIKLYLSFTSTPILANLLNIKHFYEILNDFQFRGIFSLNYLISECDAKLNKESNL